MTRTLMSVSKGVVLYFTTILSFPPQFTSIDFPIKEIAYFILCV